jgi:hypothetical protein
MTVIQRGHTVTNHAETTIALLCPMPRTVDERALIVDGLSGYNEARREVGRASTSHPRSAILKQTRSPGVAGDALISDSRRRTVFLPGGLEGRSAWLMGCRRL